MDIETEAKLVTSISRIRAALKRRDVTWSVIRHREGRRVLGLRIRSIECEHRGTMTDDERRTLATLMDIELRCVKDDGVVYTHGELDEAVECAEYGLVV